MTSGSDIILKSWLRTLRYSIECYEDTFEPLNESERENERSAKNMLIDEDASDDSENDRYVNIWDCSNTGKMVEKLTNSLESVENASEVSNFDGDRSSLNTQDSLKITDLDDDVKRVRKKPVAAPRTKKPSIIDEPIYANFSSLEKKPKPNPTSDNIYENIPLRSQKTSLDHQNQNLENNTFKSTDSLKFEEEVFQTIQYLEDVIGSATLCSEDSESEDLDSIQSRKNSPPNYYTALESNYHENVDDRKFTDSSSSFGDYEHSNPSEKINQRFAKDTRVSIFLEEPEPCPQEFKNIPLPKGPTSILDKRKRFSVPSLKFPEAMETMARPHSLDDTNSDMKIAENDQEPIYQNLMSPNFGDIAQKTDVINSDEKLILNFAKESRVSCTFDDEVLEELQELDLNPVQEDEQLFIQNLREDSVFWMVLLMDECYGELDNILEEKELLKSINEVPKGPQARPAENKFPYDVEIRRKPEIRTNRLSKTTDFDVGRRRQTSPSNKNFDIRGLMKMQVSINPKPDLVKWKDEYIAYENENFYRIKDKTKDRVLLYAKVVIKSVRYLKSKECKEIELKDIKNVTYLLHFQDLKLAKQFMENEKIQVYINDNKITIKKTLLRFLGKRSSREILERKGIYRNEPIFGNTLRDIKTGTHSLVPQFIIEVTKLLERPENIKSLGLYRTSGNLATIQKIRFEVDNGKLSILEQYAKDPDVLTGSLKLFFRELKEPLIPREVCEKLLDLAKLNAEQISIKDQENIRSILLKNLHEANLETFVVIMKHLLEVIKYKEHNKMDSYNLAVCWGPSIIFSITKNINPTIELSKDIVSLSHDATRLIDFFLVYYELYPTELDSLIKRPRFESISEKVQTLRRQESRESDWSLSSAASQKKSSSNLSLSVDEVLKRLIEFIEPHILTCEDLYRKSGSSDKTNKIMKKLNKKKIGELDKYKNDIYELTDALKKYLKEQDSLINEGTIEDVLKVSPDSSQGCLEPNTRRKVATLIEDNAKKDTLIFLLRHLAKVVECQESNFNVPKNELINIWTPVLNNQKKGKISNEDFSKFLAIAIKVFNDNLPDVVRSSFNNTLNKTENMNELMKEMKSQQAERDRNSRYDNVDSDAGEASVLDDKTEQTKL